MSKGKPEAPSWTGQGTRRSQASWSQYIPNSKQKKDFLQLRSSRNWSEVSWRKNCFSQLHISFKPVWHLNLLLLISTTVFFCFVLDLRFLDSRSKNSKSGWMAGSDVGIRWQYLGEAGNLQCGVFLCRNVGKCTFGLCTAVSVHSLAQVLSLALRSEDFISCVSVGISRKVLRLFLFARSRSSLEIVLVVVELIYYRGDRVSDRGSRRLHVHSSV